MRRLLERWVRAGTTPQRLVLRSRIALMLLDGVSPGQIAARLGVAHGTVRLWITRFRQGGPSALRHDAPGRGRHALVPPQTVKAKLETAQLLDASGRVLSLRRAAAVLGLSTSAVWRALRRVR